MKTFALISVGLFSLGGMAVAQDLSLPSPANRTYEYSEPNGAYIMPTGPYFEGQMNTQALTGSFSLEVWRLAGSGRSSQSLVSELANQLTETGYEVLYQCGEVQCGGFDFRFGTLVANEPHMHVDLGDYQYLAARKPGALGDAFTTLIISRSPGAGFVQIARIGPKVENAPVEVTTVTSTMTNPTSAIAMPGAPISEQLDLNGYAVLADLEFQTGSSNLGTTSFDSLGQLAAYLKQHPTRTIALVGHTDAEGSLEVNIAISRRRAASVRKRLISEFGIASGRMQAQGVGFLSPIGSNLTEGGRTKNRRVEVVLTSTQ